MNGMNRTWVESLMTVTVLGRRFWMLLMTREVEKSCQALKTACKSRTMSRTIARARLEANGGFPSGFLERG